MGTTKEEHEREEKKSSKSSSSKKKSTKSTSKLTKWINSKLDEKGTTASAAKKNAGKYSSIAAAKKAGSLYYKDSKGNIKVAAYASDLDSVGKRPSGAMKKAKIPPKRPSPANITDLKEGESIPAFQSTTVVQASGKLKPSAKGMGQFESPFQGPLSKKITNFFERRNEGLKKDAEKRKGSGIKEVNEFKKAKEAAEKKSKDFYNNLSKTPAFKNLPKKTQNMIKNLATGKIPMADSARKKEVDKLMKGGMNIGGLTQSPMQNGLSRKINPTTGLTMNKGGMTDYRKKGMFYGGGMARRGR
tara:strand:- start:433 stop:1335 length:903 start_codon:yes stop_codon:yes gene_type:complete